MARHTNETLTVQDMANMTEEELNAYSKKALKKIVIRTAVGIGIGVVALVGVSALTSKFLPDLDDQDENDDED